MGYDDDALWWRDMPAQVQRDDGGYTVDLRTPHERLAAVVEHNVEMIGQLIEDVYYLQRQRDVFAGALVVLVAVVVVMAMLLGAMIMGGAW